MGNFNIPPNDTKHCNVQKNSNTPMSVSYDQAGVSSNQSNQDLTKERFLRAAQIAKKIGTTSFLDLGIEATRAIKKTDKEKFAENFRNGMSGTTNKTSKITNSVKENDKGVVDKFNNLDSLTKKKIIGGVASVALALSLQIGRAHV